ncbi:SpoIIE family protein phosphatase [Enorma massiliensis]|uniref:SpoIIE family protein phosphatase n=1 Tax=Enorma massiliensis TaxID=1472761 RepID=UPI0034A33480
MCSANLPAPGPRVRRLGRAALVCGACAIVFYIVLEVFLRVPAFNGATQIRPASGVGPVLGLFFGAPGILGCALGNLVSDAHYESAPIVLLVYFAVQLAYNAMPRLAWRRLFPEDERPVLSSPSRIMAFMLLSLADAALVTLLLMPLEFDAMQALNIHAVRLLNNFLSLMYVGTPLLLALGHLGSRRTSATLAQRVSLIMLAFAVVASLSVLAAFVASQMRSMMAEDHFAEAVAIVYIALAAITVCCFTAASALLYLVQGKLAQPIDLLAQDARSFAERFEVQGPRAAAEGGMDIALPDERPLPEIRELVDASNSMRRDLGRSVLASEEAVRERERVSAELDVATTIQLASLPRAFADLGGVHAASIDAFMCPAREVGGDFYDCFPLPGDRLCLLVADVSDKGMPAALFMMRAMAEIRECIRGSVSLGKAFTYANAHLCQQNDSMLFVTAFACVLDAVTGELEYVNAGHMRPWRFCGLFEDGWQEVPAGLPLGAMDWFDFESRRAALVPGEGMLLYTDGVTEARNASGELFGDDRLASLVRGVTADMAAPADAAANAPAGAVLIDAATDDAPAAAAGAEGAPASADAPAARVCRAVRDGVERFAAGAEQADDITACSFVWLPGARTVVAEPCDEECPRLQAAARAAAGSCSAGVISAASAQAIDLVVEELFINIVRHAFPDGNPVPVRARFAFDEARGALHIVLADAGVPFDPTEPPVPRVSGDGADLEPGGLGILLVRSKTEALWYRREGGFNVVHALMSVEL